MPKAKDKTKRRRVQEIEVLILIYERLFFSLTSGDYKWTNGYTNVHERISLQDGHCSQSQRSGRR